MKRVLTVALFGVAAWLAPSESSAESLVYVDASGDVAAARPDGSASRKLVSNGLRKSSLAIDANGRIAYFSDDDDSDPFHFLIDRTGKRLAGPFLFGDMGLCGYISPFRSAFSPDGTWLAVTYSHGNSCNSADFTFTTRLVDADGPTLNGSVYGSFTYLFEPRFLPRNQPLLSGVIANEINVWRAADDPVMTPWIALNDPNWDIDSFDYDPTRNRMIMEQSPAGIPTSGGERRDFLLLDFESPGSPNLTAICTYDGLASSSAQPTRPRFSPDGKQIAWNGSAGIFVSPAPSNNGGTCTLSPKLVVPGGSNVEWGPFDLSGLPSGGKLRITGVGGTSRAGFRKGMSVKVQAPAAGLVRVNATVTKAVARRLALARSPRGPVTVATGRKQAKPGSNQVKLKPTARAKAAWRKLAGVRVTLKALQGSRSATRTVKLTR